MARRLASPEARHAAELAERDERISMPEADRAALDGGSKRLAASSRHRNSSRPSAASSRHRNSSRPSAAKRHMDGRVPPEKGYRDALCAAG